MRQPRTTDLTRQCFEQPSPSTVLVAASYGHLIPNDHLDRFAPLHALNIHPSLLPKYAGAAPIQWAIANGDTETGVTVQEVSRQAFDRGKILATQAAVR